MTPWLSVLVVPAALIAFGDTTSSVGFTSKDINYSMSNASGDAWIIDENSDGNNAQDDNGESPIVVAPPNATIIVPGPVIIVPPGQSGSSSNDRDSERNPDGQRNDGPEIGQTDPIRI